MQSEPGENGVRGETDGRKRRGRINAAINADARDTVHEIGKIREVMRDINLRTPPLLADSLRDIAAELKMQRNVSDFRRIN